MGFFISIILGMLAIYYINVGINFIKIFTLSKKRKDEKYRFDNDILSIDDIYSLSPREFEFWSGDFLTKLGYEVIENTEIGPDGGKDIICKKNNELVYVECKRYYYMPNAPRYVTQITVKKLVGAMVHDNIKIGVIITTGIISDEAYSFAKTLNQDISIKIIDWKEIISIYNNNKYIHKVNNLKLSEI